jgi:hypothetical protein
MRNGTSWTESECERLRQLIESGCSAARASVIFKRTISSVQNRARKIGRPFPDRREAKRTLRAKCEAAERGPQR